MTEQEVKKIITQSKVSPELKEKLFSILSSLGKHTLDGLGAEMSRTDSVPIAAYLTQLWQDFGAVLSGLKTKDQKAVSALGDLFETFKNKFNPDDQRYFLYFVLDVRMLATGGRTPLSAQEYQHLIEYEAANFWELPREEVLFLLGNHCLFLLSKIDLVRDMQVAAYNHDWDYYPDFGKIFSNPLSENKELVGGKGIGSWIQEFTNSSKLAISERSTLQIAEFFQHNPAALKLSKNDKDILGEILKAYLWILNGQLDEQEVRKYKEAREDQIARAVEASLKSSGTPVPAAPAPRPGPPPVQRPAVPAPRPVPKPAPRPLPQIPIDLPVQVPRTLGATGGVNVQKRLYKEDVGDEKAGLAFQGRQPSADSHQPQPNPEAKLQELKKKMEQNDSKIQAKLQALKKKIGDK